MSTKKEIINIYDFSIKADTIYEVREKFDSEAPDGFQRERTSKVLSANVIDSYPLAAYDSMRNSWDTGLYENSKALVTAEPDSSKRKKMIESLTKHIVKPIEDLQGEDILSPKNSNNDFWDNKRVRIGQGTIFNTSDPEQTLALYLSILHRRLTPKSKESHPMFKIISQFCIEDKEEMVDKKLKREMDRTRAQGEFYNLLKNDKDALGYILQWLGMGDANTADESVLYSIFNRYVDDETNGYQNNDLFLKAIDQYSTERGAEEMYIHSKLKDLKGRGKVLVRRNEIYMDDIYIGRTFKEAAAAIQNDKELKEAFQKHIE